LGKNGLTEIAGLELCLCGFRSACLVSEAKWRLLRYRLGLHRLLGVPRFSITSINFHIRAQFVKVDACNHDSLWCYFDDNMTKLDRDFQALGRLMRPHSNQLGTTSHSTAMFSKLSSMPQDRTKRFFASESSPQCLSIKNKPLKSPPPKLHPQMVNPRHLIISSPFLYRAKHSKSYPAPETVLSFSF
jgi:hypothetical protein